MSPIIVTSILNGLVVTLQVIGLALLVAAPLSLVAALGRISRHRALRAVATVYVEFLRGTSALVQLFWAFYVLPELGFTFPPFGVEVVVLGLNASAYGAEVVRGAVQAVPQAQWEVAQMLGLRRTTTMWRIILPQAMPIALPGLGNIAIDVMKASALVSLVTVSDFTREITRWATSGNLNVTAAFSILLIGYLLISLPLTGTFRLIEWRAGRFLPGRQGVKP